MIPSHSLLSLAALLLVARATHGYSLVNTYDATNFFDYFNFFTAADPTGGYVQYVSEDVAMSENLAGYQNGQVYLGVDYTTYNPSAGRASVRVTSDIAYTQGLFIADIAHMPGGICGVWPAFWTFGPNWPSGGEIDIIEGVNMQTTDSITLHTAAGCTVTNSNSIAGTTTLTTNCNQNNANTGCGVSTSNTQGYGTGFNNIGGGVYAMQWASDGIYVWFFPRGSIPSDITAGAPLTTNWGTPTASFSGSGCDFDTYFQNNNIVFDTTFCGSWAGLQSVWDSGSCASYADTCDDYVAENPGAFENAYWLINSVKVYQ